ncbi:DNA-binding response regulator [Pseudidiomarina aestuarii]|uniref:DNA-binding response regulator n=1 Tax=Pseudidiomarina aestuarii TaxID=624146 RepID=A0A7Z6ZTN7_9GAMM|nr:response regulator transcription factor [Pseudidiomarina aestuarii]RUO41202.1 DNA-binding response regulator [Pseudidiomarina aestuarii]
MESPIVLFVDDEVRIRSFVRISMQAEGFEFYEASSAEGAWDLHQALPVQLIILDLGLPDHDGIWLLKRIRAESSVPILVLSARDEEQEKVKLLECGANDYLTKPFGIRELVARVRVLLRDLPTKTDDETRQVGALTLVKNDHSVVVDGQSIALSNKEFLLLWALAERPQTVVPHKELLSQIWGASHREDSHYLRIFIRQLRRKLNDDATHPRFIETIPSIGYRLLLP